jgi:hypothetical protein
MWLRKLFARRRCSRRHGKPWLEVLENRCTPTTLTVTTTSDAVGHTGVSLRDAIASANADSTNGTSDTIQFASNLSGQTITLAQGELQLAGGTPIIEIDGSTLSQPITINGNQGTRPFWHSWVLDLLGMM